MPHEKEKECVALPIEAEAALIAGARNEEPVRGLTHGFYKYPARFSPAFARAAIEAFTRPGDLVLDPYVGGGTTAVEALVLGRNAIGIDISSLAAFVAKVKTTIYSEAELDRLAAWASRAADSIDIHKPAVASEKYVEQGYYKHLSSCSRWRLRKALDQGIASAIALGSPRLEAFARCVLLRTGQWALDGRSKQVTIPEFREYLRTTALGMLSGARELRSAVISGRPGDRPSIAIYNRTAVGMEHDFRLRQWCAPKLVLTSPPYPGVHVLYHRWQVDGRKESAIPFVIANKLDGAGLSHYTMGDRKYPGLKTYFETLSATMSSIAALADERTIVIQMVAFSDASWQLERYLTTMREAGFVELFLSALDGHHDGRLWRTVPGRRWYSEQRGKTPGSKEVVLIHRKVSPLRDGAAFRRPWRSSLEASVEV
jgi:hypothetical protein